MGFTAIKEPVGGKPGIGSREDTEVVQTLLNRHAKTVGYSVLKVDGEVGKRTLAAIKRFQQACVTEIKPDSKVHPNKATLSTLNFSASELKAYVKGMTSDDPADGAQCIVVNLGKRSFEFNSQKEADKFLDTVTQITISGKVHYFIGKEWDTFKADMIKTLNRTVVLGARSRATSAMSLWDHFNELNNDQYVVSWFVSLVGPDLPSRNLIRDANIACNAIDAAVKTGDFLKIQKALQAAEKPVNEAYNRMKRYEKEVVGAAEGWVTALEFTKTTSFIIVGAMATPMVAAAAGTGALATAAIVGGGTGIVKASANELGKYAVGTSGGLKDAAKNIAIEGAVDATVGAVLKSKHGERLIKGAGEKLAKTAASKWLGKVSGKTAEKYVTAYIQNAGEAGVEQAVKEAGKMLKGKTKPEEFIGNVAKAMATNGFMKGFDKVVDAKYGQAVYDGMARNVRSEVFGKLKPADAVKIINDSIKGPAGELAGKGMDAALAAASGKEQPKQLVDIAASKMLKGSDFAKFKKIVAAQAKKKRR